MAQPVDIKEVLKESVSEVSIDALSRKGFKQVKVLNQGTVMRLISEAVDRVLNDRSKEISKEEREKVIRESRSQFEILAKKRLEKERSRIDELEQENRSLNTDLETLRKRASASVTVQADRDQAMARASALESEVGAKADELKRLGSFAEMTIAELKERATRAEKRVAELEEQAKGSSPGDPAMVRVLSMITDRLEKSPESSEVKEIKLALDGLSRRLSNLNFRGVAGGDISDAADQASLESFFAKQGGDKVESNVSKVKVKEAKAGAVKGALAKLKELQKGVEDGQ
jgi:hypothetical protein